jgi:hypothetical protein
MPELFGHPDEWAYFAEHRPALIEVLSVAHCACLDLLQAAQAKLESPQDNTILAIALACLKEFEEIVLLCGNGYGSGANKLLRAFFERVITLGYLAKHPDKVHQFIDYSDVHWHKLLIEARDKHANIGLSEGDVARIENAYAGSKERYVEDVCNTCKTKKRIQGSWTKKTVPDMAEDVDTNLRLLYFNAFLRPTFLIHTTFYGVTAVGEKNSDEKVHFFSPKNERAIANETIDLAHILLIQMAITVNSYYKLVRDSVLETLGKNLARANQR